MIDLKKDSSLMIICAVIALILFWLILLDPSSQVFQVIRTILGSIFLLFLPGYRMTRVFFEHNEIDFLERIALSFALSISVIPLLVFYLNLAGVKISAIMVFIVTCLVMVGCLGRLYFSKAKVNK